MKYKVLIMVVGFIMSFSQAFPQNFTDEKNYTHQFSVTSKTTLDVSNKYGKVQLLSWNKDSVKIDIHLFISSSSLTRLNKFRQNVNFDVTNSGYYVIAKTVFGKSQSTVLDELKDFADALVLGSNEVKIDYTIYLPKYLSVKVNNKYGDIYVDDLEGETQLNLSNGDLKANSFSGNAVLTISFGNAFINEFSKGRILAEYGDLNIRNADKISLETKSSKVTLQNGRNIKLQSRRDNYHIDNAAGVTGDGYFSDINIQNLSEEFNFSAKFGKVVVDNLKGTFSFVNINTEYADLDLYFEHGTSFEYDISYYKDVLIRMPKEAVETETKPINADMSQKVTYGKVGSNTANNKVKIVAPKKCYLNLYMK
jgi:hypothetical protein